MEFFESLFWTLVVVYAVLRLLNAYLERKLEIDSQILERLESKIIPIKVEVINGVIYCWNSTNDDFICQGADYQEIATNFRVRYPSKWAHIVDGPTEILQDLKKQLEEKRKVLS